MIRVGSRNDFACVDRYGSLVRWRKIAVADRTHEGTGLHTNA